ncbi:MAG: hypothetical protein HYZ53_26680 [Planctomycetes bacterium]|nr:hypothetical protein [Planctomycetota bacterium]
MPDLSPKDQERILEALVEQGFVSPEQADEVRQLARIQAAAEGAAARGPLDHAVDRRFVTSRVVDEVARLRAFRARRLRGRIAAITWSALAALFVGGALFALHRSGLFSKSEPPPLEVRRLHSREPDELDDRKAYEKEKRRRLELRKVRHNEIEAWLSAHQAEAEIQLAVEKQREAADAARRATEERRRLEEERARQAAEEAARTSADRQALEDATAEYDRFVPEIENYVRFFAYAKAIAEYGKYRETLKFDVLRQRADLRVSQVRELDAMHTRLKEAMNGRKLADDKIQYGETEKREAVIASANDDSYEVTFPGGNLRMRWAYLRPRDLYGLYRRMVLGPSELVALGIFCYESELPAEAVSAFVAAIARDPSVKPALDKYVAGKRGVGIPPGGFVVYHGLLVTPAERAQYEKGLIKCGNLWIRPDEIAFVLKGYVKQGEQWIPRKEAELLAKGYRKYKGKWYTSDELAVVRQKWEDAWELDTEHYHIRSNTTEAFAKELGECLEQAYLAYKEQFGGEPRGGKGMQVLAFRLFEDYRNFCIEEKAEGLIPAQGHTNAGKNYASGYSRSGEKELLGTMLHEGAHLFYGRTWGDLCPSWYHEGLATFFEGYTWDKKKLVFHHVSPYRLGWLKSAFRQGQYLPLAELLQGDAIASIHKGARDSTLFYAEAWGLYYWLNRSGNGELKQKFDVLAMKYRTRAFGDAVRQPAGALASFTDVFGTDLAFIEEAWKGFLAGVQMPK